MELQKRLLIKPREKSGAITSSKYDYQKNWSLYKILSLLGSDKNFTALFDYHEDLLIIDNDSQNANMDFYQIKCVRKVNWTKRQLLERKKGKFKELNSILGKLVYNLVVFDKLVNTLNFISNAPVKLKLKDGKDSKELQSFSLEDSTDKGEILTQISKELGNELNEDSANKILFKKTDLNEDGSEKYMLGILVEFLSKNYQHLLSKCKPIYNTLFGEIKIRSNFSGEFTSIEECISKKGMSRGYLLDIFDKIEPEKTSKEICRSCNKPIIKEKDVKFCKYCGKKLNAS